MEVTNTLAYIATATISGEDFFKVQATVVENINFLSSVRHNKLKRLSLASFF
jgi:hypothetical protein